MDETKRVKKQCCSRLRTSKPSEYNCALEPKN
jgi:hypothetical protein